MSQLHYLLALLMIGLNAYCSLAQNCQTPSGTQGQCVPFKDCSYVVKYLRNYGKNLPENIRSYIFNSGCTGADATKFSVCCDTNFVTSTDVIFTSNNGNYETSLNPNGVALLKQFSCGITNTNHVSFGNKTRLAEYPWMALLRYDSPNQPFQCGGSLISNRYVVTAAHCIKNTQYNLIGVRLGEHDIDQDEDCARRRKKIVCYRAEDYGIETTIPHPGYSRIQHINDVGLIRLSSSVQFKANIAPICLPITNNAAQLRKYPEKYILSGWGLTQADEPSKILLKAEIPSRSRSYCQDIYKKSTIKIEHICAGGENRVDSCYGDSGGPLFSSELYDLTARYVLYGVISGGVAKCGDINSYPGVYTNVVQFMSWITDQISS